ncbi:MAG: hypothetical protein K2M80_03610, partial [Muribaculaceae bacterium]|nr:hypothetical protein [Muribaculaceae bacterium]
ADGAISRAVAQAGIYPFDGLQGSIGAMPADGKIYRGSGENRFVSNNERGEPVYHYEPTAGYADPKSLYRCDNKLYKVTSWNQLVEFVDSDKLEEREQHLTTFAINVADEAVWRAKEELFADLWENYLTEWTPFGGVAGADNILPHLSLKIGGVEIDEEGNRRYKLFGFELTYEKALEVLAKPDPACFNGIGSINAYLSKFSNIAGALDLSIPRQPLQYFAGNFNSTFTQYGLRSIILPQITLQNITSSVALPEAILVYGVAFANVFAGCNYLRELYLLLPPQSLNLSSCPQLSEESVVRLIELSKAYNDTGINISTTLALHPDVYDALSDETFELAFSSQVSLVSTKKS